MATVREIARKTGYSITTVSRVLSEDPDFSASEETRDRIHSCAKALNYVYKGRKKNQTDQNSAEHRVGIVPIGMEESGRGELQDPYYLYIRNGVESALNRAGLFNSKMISMEHLEDYEKLNDIDSLIVIGKKRFDENNLYFKKLQNVIYVDYDPDPSQYDSVTSNFRQAVICAMDYMRNCGCETIGYIGSWDYVNDFGNNDMIRSQDLRHKVYEDYCKEKDMEGNQWLFIGDKFTKGVGYELTKEAIRQGNLPEAFLIGSDPMAVGVYRAFSEEGIQIGKEIRLVSIDDVADTAYMNPPLTSVHLSAVDMGEMAVECLLQRLKGRKIPVRVQFPVSIEIRESCRKM